MKILCKPIEMISWTESNGTIHPIRFQVENIDNQKMTYKIIRIYKTAKEKLAGNIMYKYTCEILLNDTSKICEIRYELDTCKWILFKI